MTQEQVDERIIRMLEEIKQDLQGRIDRIRESMKPEPIYLCWNAKCENMVHVCGSICNDCLFTNGVMK